MLLRVPGILTPNEVSRARELLAGASWSDGRATAGEQAAVVKNNEQLNPESEASRLVSELVLYALNRHPDFFSAALPKKISPPLCNRYGGSTNTYGSHVDSAVRYVGAMRVRTDISCTLFLSEPGDYDGGELEIEDLSGNQTAKYAAGDVVLYPGNRVHRVTPVTRGQRYACFFWIESMVRATEQRQLLHGMDRELIRLRTTLGETDSGVVALTGTYHNLLRMWADV
ncbi:MAG: Fe2+-dependent dioxygenase [Betaproteobacteria bacterium]